jgi:hypothetical protein
MYKYDLTFLNTYNAAVSFSPDGKNIRENNTCLEVQSALTYLKEKKNLVHRFNDNFQTELILSDNLIYCYASINNTKILFNVLPVIDFNILKEKSKLSLEQLEFVHNIKEENILGTHKILLSSGFPIELKIINTCDSFLNFVKLNGGYPNRKMNKDLLSAFQQQLQLSENNFDVGNVCVLQNKETPHRFKYIHFYNLIIITEYFKEKMPNSNTK